MSGHAQLLRLLALACVGALILIGTAMAGEFAVNIDATGLALRGHDPVAYFSDGRATLGDPDKSATVDSAKYYFASAQNRLSFVTHPSKYTPAFGGFCALGVTDSLKVDGDPQAWRIVDNTLYINSSHQSLATWSQDTPGNIKKGNEIWPLIKEKDPADLW